VCSLPKAVGPCRATFPRWFYNSATQRCESFTYGGCGGNANQFKTISSVRVPVIVVSSVVMLCLIVLVFYFTDQCTLQPDPGPCRGFIPRYFYNVETRKCEKFTYGDCKGNGNRFSSIADCTSPCSGQSNDITYVNMNDVTVCHGVGSTHIWLNVYMALCR